MSTVGQTAPTEVPVDERKLWLVVAMLGIGALVIGCFLPIWDVNSVGFFKVQGNAVIKQGWGWTNLLLAGLAAIALVRAYSRSKPTIGPLILGGLALAYAIYIGTAHSQRTLCPASATTTSDPGCQLADPGFGVYVIGAGGGAMLIAGLFLARQKTYEAAAAAAAASAPTSERVDLSMYRECPHCKERMRRDAGTCPHCRKESRAWTLKNGLWWLTNSNGVWFWRDEEAEDWMQVVPAQDSSAQSSGQTNETTRSCVSRGCSARGVITKLERCDVCGNVTHAHKTAQSG